MSIWASFLLCDSVSWRLYVLGVYVVNLSAEVAKETKIEFRGPSALVTASGRTVDLVA